MATMIANPRRLASCFCYSLPVPAAKSSAEEATQNSPSLLSKHPAGISTTNIAIAATRPIRHGSAKAQALRVRSNASISPVAECLRMMNGWAI